MLERFFAIVGLILALVAEPASGQCDPLKTFSFQGPGSLFGSSLALEGDHILVGAKGKATVWFFEYLFGVWVPNAPAANDAIGTGYGDSLAMNGGRALIGVPYRTVTGVNGAGEVELWSRLSGSWTHTATFSSPGPNPNAHFGFSVDIDGDRIIVGEPGYSSGRGRAHLFAIDANEKAVFLQTINPTASIQGEANYGYDVAISPKHAVVGVPFADQVGFTGNGTAMLYQPDVTSTTWTYKSKFTFPDFNVNTGAAVDVFGNRIVIGMPYLGIPAPGMGGRAIVVDWVGGVYTLVHQESNSKGGYEYGAAVAIDGSRVVIGMPRFDEDLQQTDIDHGAFQVLRKDPAGFVASGHAFLLPAGRLGEAVAVSGTRVVVGAPTDDSVGVDAGAFITYDAATTSFHYDATPFDTSIPNLAFGPPELDLDGSLCNDELAILTGSNTPPLSPAWIVLGLSEQNAPAFGGFIGPSMSLVLPVLSGPGGGFSITFFWGGQLPPGFPIWLQLFVLDSLTPQGISASQTHVLHTPY